MVELKKIIENVDVASLTGSTAVAVSGIVADSRKVEQGVVFVAIRGVQSDGHRYIADVVARGAAAVVCEQLPNDINPNVCYIRVTNTAQALGDMLSAWYEHPSRQMRVVGVTGTNGKTTIATLLYNFFRAAGYKAGLISTIEYRINDEIFPSSHTTPDALQLQTLFARMVDAQCDYCFMEVSSHAVVQRRIAGVTFAGGVFTNITHDHLDYHGTFAEYIKAKKMFFDQLPRSAFALTNADDRNGSVMVQNTQAQRKTFGIKNMADFKAKTIESHIDGTLLKVNGTEIWTRFVGDFNAANLLAVYGTARLLGESHDDVLHVMSSLMPVSGRFETMQTAEGITVIVDYAHTPDALVNVLQTIISLRKGQEKIISLVGAGGDRDKTKRPIMARTVAQYADTVILTSDNPRSERAEDIINDMKQGLDNEQLRRTLTITDRAEAIRTACMLAKRGDIVLIPGKGHENYQEIAGVKHPFSDQEMVRKTLTVV